MKSVFSQSRSIPMSFLPYNPTELFSNLLFSDEIEVQRRRKGSGPQGRAEAPMRRDSSGGGGGGSLQPGSGAGGTGGRGGKLPPWMLIVLVIFFVLCGGGGLLNSLLGGESGTAPLEAPGNTYSEQPQTIPEVSAPTMQPAPFTPPPAAGEGTTWTVMLYQDADDQILEQDIFVDFNEAERIGSSGNVHIVSQLDRFRGGFSGDGNWSGARRYYITQDADLDRINSRMVGDLGEVNMADPATLVDFVTWSMTTFPADKYVLILSDHGMGWPGGWTDGDNSDSPPGSIRAPLVRVMGNALYSNQLDEALKTIRSSTGVPSFEIVGMDACLMSQLEVLSMLSRHAKIAIASEETEPALGWAYTAFLESLTRDPEMSSTELSRQVVQTYIDADQRILDDEARGDFLRQLGARRASADQVASELGKDITISAVDLSQIPNLMESFNRLAYELQSEDQALIAQARNYSLSFTSIFGKQVPPAYLDLGNFVQILKQQNVGSTVKQYSDDVLAKINQAVIEEKHGIGKRGATGIAFYFPNSSLYRSPYSGPQSYTEVAGYFSEQSVWDDFLAYHYNDQTFEAASRAPVIPDASKPTRAPGAGLIKVSKIRSSASEAAPGSPVTLRAEVGGTNIGYAYLFTGYYDSRANSIFVADTDFLESPETLEADGVYYPKWNDAGAFTLKFEWDPIVFSISDGIKTVTALFKPQQYGSSAAEAVYAVDGIYTFAENSQELSARLNFRDGQLVSVFGITGSEDTGAPRQIVPNRGDTFTILDKWLDLNSDGSVKETVFSRGETLTFGDTPFTWVEQYAAAGDYIVGFVVSDLDGNSTETFTTIAVR